MSMRSTCSGCMKFWPKERLSSDVSNVDRLLRISCNSCSQLERSSPNVYDTLGDDLSSWLQLLQEIRKSRSTFDTSELSRSFGQNFMQPLHVLRMDIPQHDLGVDNVLAKGARSF